MEADTLRFGVEKAKFKWGALLQDSLLGSPDSGCENVAAILGIVDFLRDQQGAIVEGGGHNVVVIFAMPLGQRA